MAKNRFHRVYEYLISKNLVADKTDFAQKLGYNRTYISEVFSGAKPITHKIAQVLNEKFNISTQWLLTGKGEMGPEETNEPDVDYENAHTDSLSKAKLLRLAADIMINYADELERGKKNPKPPRKK
jgi:transcriptional regulator with XRE-family HTH domain